MYGLMLKDFYLYRKNLLVSFVVIFILSIPYFIPSHLLNSDQSALLQLIQTADIVFIYLCFGDAQTSLFSGDERKEWANYVISSPCTAKGQVLSKYYESTLLSFLCALWCIFMLTIQDALSGTESSILMVLLLFYLQFLLRAVEFPFLVRFGSKCGNYYKLGFILFLGLLLLIYGLYGDISVLPSFEKIISGISKLTTEDIGKFSLGFLGTFPWIALLLFYLSYYVSCKLYQKGIEYYG